MSDMIVNAMSHGGYKLLMGMKEEKFISLLGFGMDERAF